MLKLYFFAVIDDLSESVVNIFYARSMDHAKMIVRNGLKDSDSRVTQFFRLIQISELIEIENEFDSILLKQSERLKCVDNPLDYLSIRIDDILNENKES